MRVHGRERWRLPRWPLALVALALACVPLGAAKRAPTPAETPTPPEPLTVEEVLANPLGDADYAQSRRCLANARYRRIDIITDEALAFIGRGDTVWLNMLPHRCHGLRQDMVLAVEQSSMRVCARDRIRGLARVSAQVATSACALGPFQPLPRENFEAVRDALVAAHRNRAVAKTKRSAPAD